ncbi:MAG: hypothetical protein D6791_13175, partial [Chloroflexi bacterium]
PAESAIQIPVGADGQAEATIGRIPLQPDEETSVTVDVVLPSTSRSGTWTKPWMQSRDGDPRVHITQWVGGEAVGGNTFRPPQPLHLYLPLIKR